ncbi:MAG: hypothetical protein ACHQX4_04545 [Gemmatimonadales bacterium]
MNDRDDFALKREMEQLPKAIEPPEDLWPGVRARLAPRASRLWWRRPRALRIAALLTLLAGSAGWLAVNRHRAATWTVAFGARSGAFRAGDSLATGPETARLRVGTIGTMDVGTGSNLRLLVARAGEQRLALDRGTISARVDAPPRLFIVETPSGTAVDLGCAYTLDVDSAGNSSIHVTLGWVSFEDKGQESLIPAGMRAKTLRGGVVGTPFRDDAPDSLRFAALRYDEDPDDSTLVLVLRTSRRADAVTLWHLVARTSGAQRDEVVSRLLTLVPPSAGVTAEAVLRNDRAAMQLYWEQLPGTLKVTPEWKRRLWTWWLRVGG